MNIAVIGGTGYVGLTTAVGLASKGHRIYCVGRDKEKIGMIGKGMPMIYEENLEQMLKDVLARGKLLPTTDLENAVLNSDISFICVGTPSKDNGSIDLSQIRGVSREIGQALKRKNEYSVVVVRSTVVPGTTEEVVMPILEEYSGKKAGVDFGVCMNPEFLREGQAVKDFNFPKDVGVVIGELDARSGGVLSEVYGVFEVEILRTSLRTAEMIKYARNSYLAKDVSFANEIANICQECGADFVAVRKGMEMDRRIGKGRFLEAGAGFGGSCFPKDVRALAAKALELGVRPKILQATLEVNDLQPQKLIELAKLSVGKLEGKIVAVLGLAFKPGTDDMREAVSTKVVNALLDEGAKICAYDPQASRNARMIIGDGISYAESAREALSDADFCLIVTEWPEFSNPNLFNDMRHKIIIDGRRALNPKELPPGFIYNAVGFPGPMTT